MRGVILAGGTGSRLFPLTKVTNKHLLPVGRYPMIFHPLYRLKQAGIDDILIVTGVEHMGAVIGLLGSGRTFGVRLTYRVQDEPDGIAQALYLARDFVRDERCVVILGDNIFEDSIESHVKAYLAQPSGARILLKEVPDPHRFGVAEVRDGRVVSIEEKPLKPKSNLCVTGVYMYDSDVFDIISTLKPSARGELEITDVNNAYIRRGDLSYSILTGWWTDAGTFESLKRSNDLAKDLILDFDSCGTGELKAEKEAAATRG